MNKYTLLEFPKKGSKPVYVVRRNNDKMTLLETNSFDEAIRTMIQLEDDKSSKIPIKRSSKKRKK